MVIAQWKYVLDFYSKFFWAHRAAKMFHSFIQDPRINSFSALKEENASYSCGMLKEWHSVTHCVRKLC